MKKFIYFIYLIFNIMEKPLANKAFDISSYLSDYFNDCFEYVTEQHYQYCNCCKMLYDEYATQILEEFKKQKRAHDLEAYKRLNPKATNEDFENSRNYDLLKISYAQCYTNAVKEIATQAIQNDLRCSKEKKEVSNTLKLFVEKYPSSLNDPIFVEIVKSVLNHQLTVYRLRKALSQTGVIQHYEDRNGNDRIAISPLLEAQREFDKVKVDALMVLDRKLNGEKQVNLNMNLNTEPIPISELYKLRRS